MHSKQEQILRQIISRSDNLRNTKRNEEHEKLLMELLISDDSEDADSDMFIAESFRNRREVLLNGRFYRPYVESFYYHTVLNYTEDEFSLHFRMRRASFETLVGLLEAHLPETQADHKKAILFTLYMLSHSDNIRLGSHKFGFSHTIGHRLYKLVVKAIMKIMPDYIKWPSLTTRRTVASRFESKCGIPGIVGAIDGCHIPIKQPVGKAVDYYNRKQFHSVLLQGTCDDRMIFIDIEVGHPGMFVEGALGTKLATAPSTLLTPNQHILGDCAYPNSDYLVTPFKNNGRLTNRKTMFHNRVCSGQSIIENAFGQLKGKFRRLKFLDMSDMDLLEQIIAACCILHNFIIMQKDDSPLVESAHSDYSSSDDEDNNQSPAENNVSCKREQLMELLEGKPPFRKKRLI